MPEQETGDFQFQMDMDIRTRTPSTTPLQPKKWNACFWITFNFWWSAGLVNGLEPHLPPLSSQKNEMLIFGLRSISDDRPSDLSNEQWLKCKKRPPKSLKNEMFIFWWSTRRLPEDHQKTSGSLLVVFLHYGTRKFLWKITLLHGQLCHKPYGFLVMIIHGTTAQTKGN